MSCSLPNHYRRQVWTRFATALLHGTPQMLEHGMDRLMHCLGIHAPLLRLRLPVVSLSVVGHKTIISSRHTASAPLIKRSSPIPFLVQLTDLTHTLATHGTKLLLQARTKHASRRPLVNVKLSVLTSVCRLMQCLHGGLLRLPTQIKRAKYRKAH